MTSPTGTTHDEQSLPLTTGALLLNSGLAGAN
mgnify:CR=1 FL=1